MLRARCLTRACHVRHEQTGDVDAAFLNAATAHAITSNPSIFAFSEPFMSRLFVTR